MNTEFLFNTHLPGTPSAQTPSSRLCLLILVSESKLQIVLQPC